MPFFEKYSQVTQKHNSYVCIGLDSDINKIPSFLKTEKDPVLTFNKRIIDETYRYAAAYKPNFAFYITQGEKGIETLKATIDYIPDEVTTIFDIKAGDIGNTMEYYAQSAFNYFRADSMTINILMGSDVINACLSVENSYAFVLALTSNKSAIELFKHASLYEKIAEMIKTTGHERLGAVVGATNVNDLSLMRKLMPESVFLVPGIGAQGGDLEQVCRLAKYKTDEARLLISSSRNIIFADDSKDFAKAAKKETIKLQTEINKLL